MAVEVGAYLAAVEPGATQLLQRGLDVLVLEVADVGGSGRAAGRGVAVGLGLGEDVDAAEEVRHVGVVFLAHLAEVGEELLAVLAGAVPGEDDELGGLPTGPELLELGLVGLGAYVGGGTVAYQFYRVRPVLSPPVLVRLVPLAAPFAVPRRGRGARTTGCQHDQRGHPRDASGQPPCDSHEFHLTASVLVRPTRSACDQPQTHCERRKCDKRFP